MTYSAQISTLCREGDLPHFGVQGEIRTETLSVVSEQWELLPEAAVTHKTSLRLSSTHPRGRRQLVPPVHGRLGACPLPSPPSHPSGVSQFPPSQGYQDKKNTSESNVTGGPDTSTPSPPRRNAKVLASPEPQAAWTSPRGYLENVRIETC